MVLAIPKPGTNILCVQIIRRQDISAAFTKRFDSSAQAVDLWGLSFRGAGPEIAQITVVEAIGHIIGDVCREAGSEVPRYLWTARN